MEWGLKAMKKLEEKDIKNICSLVTINIAEKKIQDTCGILASYIRIGFAALILIIISFSFAAFSVYSGSISGIFVCGFVGFCFIYVFGKIEQDRFKVCQRLAEDIYRISVNSVIMYIEQENAREVMEYAEENKNEVG